MEVQKQLDGARMHQRIHLHDLMTLKWQSALMPSNGHLSDGVVHAPKSCAPGSSSSTLFRGGSNVTLTGESGGFIIIDAD